MFNYPKDKISMRLLKPCLMIVFYFSICATAFANQYALAKKYVFGVIVAVGPSNEIVLSMDKAVHERDFVPEIFNVIEELPSDDPSRVHIKFRLADVATIDPSAIELVGGKEVTCRPFGSPGEAAYRRNLYCFFFSKKLTGTAAWRWGNLTRYLVGNQLIVVNCSDQESFILDYKSLHAFCQPGYEIYWQVTGEVAEALHDGRIMLQIVSTKNLRKKPTGLMQYYLTFIDQLDDKTLADLNGRSLSCFGWGRQKFDDAPSVLCREGPLTKRHGPIVDHHLNWKMIRTGEATPDCDLNRSILAECN